MFGGSHVRALLALAAAAGLVHAQPAPPPSDVARDLVGTWEISNAERDKRCTVTFSIDAAPGGLKLALDPDCGNAFPALKEVVVWTLGAKDAVRLLDLRGGTILEFNEVESGMYEAERKGEGLFFMQSQAAVKAAIRTPEQLFGDWKVLRELDAPLCTVTLSSAKEGNDAYKIVIRQGCHPSIAAFGLANWRLDRDQLVLTGRSGAWRFAESDPTTWERFPLSTDPLLLMRQ